MSKRVPFRTDVHQPFSFDVDRTPIRFEDCYKYAEIANMDADILDNVLKTADGRYFYLTVVSSHGDHSAFGITDGWYTVREVQAAEAEKIRQSWAVLREQPPAPSGPWK